MYTILEITRNTFASNKNMIIIDKFSLSVLSLCTGIASI